MEKHTPIEINDTDLDEVSGGWIIIDSMSAPLVNAKRSQMKGILLAGDGNDFVSGGEGNDI